MLHTIAVHPGKVLADELSERGIKQSTLATHIDVLSKTINGLPAKLFTGTANIANTKMPFVAAVVQDKGPAFVVFAFPANNAHVKQMIASINSIRGAKSGK